MNAEMPCHGAKSPLGGSPAHEVASVRAGS